MTAQPDGAGGAIAEVLARARTRLQRLGPEEALAAQRAGALLVDIRPHAYRAAEGALPGALAVERNVLEWRLDPTSPDRLPEAEPGRAVVVVCNEGYASSLAAVQLHDVGVTAATDLAGGFRAWRAAGLPVAGPGPAAEDAGPV